VSGLDREHLGRVVREVVERLAPLDRTPCSPGERAAAEWLSERLRSIAGVEVALEDEPSWGTFPPTATAIGVLGLCGAGLVRARRRRPGSLLALLAMAGVIDEAQNGPRIVRRLLRRKRTTVNLVAQIGSTARDPSREIDTIVVLAHHDAPQTGLMFDQSLQKRIFELAPSLIARSKKPPPQWWIGLAGPLLTLAAAGGASRRLTSGAFAFGLLGVGMVADVWRSETVQGANDNLSGVAALVALAESLEREPLEGGLRVMLVSAGAEETLQDGIRAFVARHRSELDPRRTCFVNLDTVGSPYLVMLEGEGPIWMEEYAGAWLRDELERSAQHLGIGLERGFRARASTDSVIPSRAGYPIATLVSITDWRSPANYHLPTDIPENLVYETVVDATLLVRELAQRLTRR
jgi:hypothetical protein